MKRGVTYIVTLVSIGLLYFGSLYVVSRPSTGCLTSLVNGKSELMNRESVDDQGGVQVPLSKEQGDLIQGNTDIISLEQDNTPLTEYTIVDIKPSCTKLPSHAKKEKAVIVVLIRNNELGPMRRTLRQFEE